MVIGSSGANWLIKKPKNHLLSTFSPDFTLNRQIWWFYAEKWIFLKKLGTLLKKATIFSGTSMRFQSDYKYCLLKIASKLKMVI